MYATLTDLETRLGAETLVALADDNQDGTADEAVAEAVLSQASAMMDALLSARYAVPVEGALALLTWLCVSLAVPILYGRRREALPEAHSVQAEAAREFLKTLQQGEVILSGAASRILAESTRRGEEKHFSSGRLAEF